MSRLDPARACRLACLAALFAAALAGTPTAAEPAVRLVADVWPPYNDVVGGEREGFLIDVARLAFARHGVRVDYHNVSWDRAREGTLRGLFDGAVGATPLDGEGLVMPPGELGRIQAAFFVRRGDPWRFRGPASLEGVRLGCAQGYDYCPWLNTYIRHWEADPTRVQCIGGPDALWLNLRKLAAGRVDVVVDDPAVLRHAARELGLEDDLVWAGSDPHTTSVTIAFTPVEGKGRVWADWLAEGLEVLRQDGRLDSLRGLYGLDGPAGPSGTGGRGRR